MEESTGSLRVSVLSRQIEMLKTGESLGLVIAREALEDGTYSQEDLGQLVLVLQEQLGEVRTELRKVRCQLAEKEDLWKKALDHFA